jgi:hypothetical protein
MTTADEEFRSWHTLDWCLGPAGHFGAPGLDRRPRLGPLRGGVEATVRCCEVVDLGGTSQSPVARRDLSKTFQAEGARSTLGKYNLILHLLIIYLWTHKTKMFTLPIGS